MPTNYNNPFNALYPNGQGAQPTTYRPMAPQGNLIWVSGIEGAKAWNVAPGQSVPLFDSEAQCFYVKSADQNGFPQPLRIFDYTERFPKQEVESAPTPAIDPDKYVTKEELSDLYEAIKSASDSISDLATDVRYLKDKESNRKPYNGNKKGGSANA